MSGANSDDQRGVDQSSIHQGNITRHQDENTITITAFHHDQANSGISTDSDSHQSHVQDALHPLASPGEQDADIYEVRDGSNTDEATHVWVKEEVELMFKYYKERLQDLNDPHKKKRDIFVDICALLRNHGYTPTPKQCDRKMRNMKATYIRTLERIKRGDTMATCQYYDELYDVYGLNPPLQTSSRVIAAQNRNRPVPAIKAEYVNGQLGQDSYEPTMKKLKFEGQDQRDSPRGQEQPADANPMMYIGSGPRDGGPNLYDTKHKAVQDLMDEVKTVQHMLQQEREAREEERKAFAEERREFHKERMSMLNSINKLIGNMDQKPAN